MASARNTRPRWCGSTARATHRARRLARRQRTTCSSRCSPPSRSRSMRTWRSRCCRSRRTRRTVSSPRPRASRSVKRRLRRGCGLRAHDHAFDVVPFVAPRADPGNYQFTGACTAATMSVPGFGNVTPFTLPDPDAFPLPDRPALDDPEWLASLIETRDYGSLDSTVRTPNQTEIALFYIEGAVTGGDRPARPRVPPGAAPAPPPRAPAALAPPA